MEQNRYITIFTYLLIIAGCMGIVFLIDQTAGRRPFPAGTESRKEEAPSAKGPDDRNERQEDKENTETGKETEAGENTGACKEAEGEDGRGFSRQKAGAGRDGIKEKGEEEPDRRKGPPQVFLATDIHYMSSRLTDYGEAFLQFTARDDGKVLRYSSQLMDAFGTEILAAKPDAVILSGDLTVNGEKLNHQELAEKLAAIQDEGVQILVIPGNHDINNPNAASYIGEEKEEAEGVTPEEFYQIYRPFGYDQAASRDEASLSYRYVLDDTHWLLMLDSCQYEPYNQVGGKIGEETYRWIRSQYEEAKKAGAVMIPVSHHNLMGESRVYPTECAIEGGEEMIAIMKEYRVPLYLSGHLHLQRIKKYQEEPGAPKEEKNVTEAVTAAFSIAPCQYGVIRWKEDNSLSYGLRTVDVGRWARENRIEDENLLDFERYSRDFVRQIVSDQAYQKITSVPEEMKRRMADLYGQVNLEYCEGRAADRKEITESEGYRLWERTQRDSPQLALINKMIADLTKDNRYWESGPEGGESLPGESGPEGESLSEDVREQK